MPEEERLAGSGRTLHEVQRVGEQVPFNRFHALLRKRARVLADLLADFAEARIFRRIVLVGSLALKYPTGAESLVELRIFRIVGVLRLLLRIEVVEVSVEFVETMQCGQIFVAVA